MPTLLRLAVVPVALFVWLGEAGVQLQNILTNAELPWLALPVQYLRNTVALLPFGLYLVSCMRLFHYESSTRGVSWPLPFSPSVLKLFLWLLPNPFHKRVGWTLVFFTSFLVTQSALLQLQGLAAGPFAQTNYPISFLIWLVMEIIALYFVLRLASLAVAAALDQHWSIRDAWIKSAPDCFSLLAIWFLAVLPVEVLIIALTWSFADFPSDSWIALNIGIMLYGLHWVLVTVLWSAVTWHAYAWQNKAPQQD